MELTLERKVKTDKATFGNLLVDWKFFAHTVEDIERDIKNDCSGKVYAETAIPVDKYQVAVTWSNRFKRPMPLVMGVHCFEGIRIHTGTSERSSAGCIIIGSASDNKTGVTADAGLVNRLIDLLTAAQSKEKCHLTIVQKYGGL